MTNVAQDADVDGVAGRVAQARKLAGLTQHQLAMRANVSVSLLRKVERGVRPPSPAFVAATANALGLGVSDLYGQPHFVTATTRLGTEQALIPDLERAIMEFQDPFLQRQPLDVDEAERQLAQVVTAGRKSQYSDTLTVLPDLLRNLHALSRDTAIGSDRERVHSILTQAYQSTMFTAYKFGHLSLCAWAAERMCWAADRSGDPLWAAMALYCRAQSLMFNGSYRTSETILTRAAQQADDVKDHRALEVRGATHLSSAIVAARLDNASDSDLHLAQAHEVAKHAPRVDHFDTAFSAANVEIHGVAAAVEMMDGATALRRAEGFEVSRTLYPSRRGHYHIDLARAWLLHGNYERSLGELQTARSLSPEQTRYHPQVHETIRALARARRRSEPIARMAAWAGVRGV